ncbi:aminopeptidase P family protein [Pontibacter sp. SGAir0037]|uniref:aminopeptidase P family protein n=1 Tax=Pontibacter sp. SGAir0037 TaxID=2571030 RepID=UPI0010CCB9DD|nr:aminopeptidase P family protein [Pontibacter sp. SGAir0037]QCR22295.1 Xaa-Pro aminopeptidase [Pontibacter sp. SGAir0037]
MFDKEVYIKRREQLRKQVGNGIILLLGNEESSMNYKDNWYPFRQDSSFLYFFGLDRPGLAAVIDSDSGNELVFGDEATVDDIVWNGTQVSLKEEAFKTGVSTVQPYSSLPVFLERVVASQQKVHYLPPYRPENLLKLSTWLQVAPRAVKENASVTLIKAIVAQRSIKSQLEVREIEKAVNITVAMQLKAIKAAQEGMTEAQVAAMVQEVAISENVQMAFSSILTVNGQTLHNHYSATVLQKGLMVLCDCGAESPMHYAGDLTRTFPVGNTFSQRQREVYEIVLSAYEGAASLLKPGILFKDVHTGACEKLVEGLKQIGLMRGDAKEAVEQGAHALFFPCGLGHMLGLDTHDMEDLGEEYVGYTESLKKSTQFGLKSLRLGRSLEPGFVLTVEPGLYFIPELIDRWSAEKKYADFINYDKVATYKDFGGIRIEEDYLINEEKGVVIGKPLPKTADAIEELRV